MATSKPQMQQSNNSPKVNPPGLSAFIALIFGFLLLLQGAHASSDVHEQSPDRQWAALRIRDVSDRVFTFAQNFGEDLAAQADTKGHNGETFAHNLVADVISSVCDKYFSGTESGDFAPTIVQDCIKSIYGQERLSESGSQFLAVFGASLLCGYVVSEAYPVAQQFSPSGCESLKDIVRLSASSRLSDASKTATPVPLQFFQSYMSNSPAAISPHSTQLQQYRFRRRFPPLLPSMCSQQSHH
ncbi:hypothetical protein CC86DRAFT_409304 [Ophiobolus disseminans]|uniref:Transmembrane protein n=1 Tax=Ophiobolus disseminans TaxID=1469910 RepID=A0A6A6ZQK7_9PLEO|nr:hypothetical protein CC86DRAFT_409304 [Ophiobolus disseminans]